MRKKTQIAIACGAAVALVGGYLVGDAYDVVPGFLTVKPAPGDPGAPAEASGAIEVKPRVVPDFEFDEDAPVPDTQAVADLVRDGIESDLNGDVSVYVTDALTGDVIADTGADHARIPASTTKLISGLTALDAMGPEKTFTTEVVKGDDSSEVIIVGGGDILLGEGDSDPEALSGRGGVGTLAKETARQLELQGVSDVSVRIDDSLFSGPELHSSWSNSLMNEGWATPVVPMAIDQGKLREEPQNEWYPTPVYDDAAKDVGEVFAEALEDQGFTVKGSVERKTASSNATRLAAVESASLREIVRQTLLVSDNALAEVVARLLAIELDLPGSFEGAATAMDKQMQRLGFDTTNMVLIDGSGLSEDARITPKTLVDLVDYAYNDSTLRDAVAHLPTAGFSGTLDDRMMDAGVAGLVRGKTGSLTGIRSLAGTVVTQDQRVLFYAIMADPGKSEAGWNAQVSIDNIASALAECGCQGT